jgi:hypothetical protein
MKAFVSYSHRDEAMRERFDAHLSMLRKEGSITDWYDRKIVAGGRIDDEVKRQLDSSQLFLALVSPDFLNSGYCYDKEMTRAIERDAAGEMAIVPIIAEPCDWLASPLGKFKAIPRDGKAISEWTNKNTAWLDVVTELRRLVRSTSAAAPSAAAAASRAPTAVKVPSKYRVKKTFDRIDRDDFRSAAYEVIRDYFEKAIKELDGVDDLRARYQAIGPNSFTCTVINRLMKHGRGGEAHITVHASPQAMLGEIFYSFAAHAPTNTANGGFSIDADDYHLFLRPNMFFEDDRNRTWSPQEAASRLWQDFLEKAGITHG